MGGITTLWLSRLETAVLLWLVKVIGWVVSLLLPLPPTTGSHHRNGRPDHLRNPPHAGPGIWYLAPRAALTGWSITRLTTAAHRVQLRAAGGGHAYGPRGRTP